MKRIEALGFLVLVALPASLAAAQPAGPHSPPPGVEHPYAAPSFPDVPASAARVRGRPLTLTGFLKAIGYV